MHLEFVWIFDTTEITKVFEGPDTMRRYKPQGYMRRKSKMLLKGLTAEDFFHAEAPSRIFLQEDLPGGGHSSQRIDQSSVHVE